MYTCPLNEVTSAYAGGLEDPLIWKVTAVECVNDPLVPVTVTLYDPVVAPVQERLEVTEPPLDGVTLVGLRPHVNPVEGDTVDDKETMPLKPL